MFHQTKAILTSAVQAAAILGRLRILVGIRCRHLVRQAIGLRLTDRRFRIPGRRLWRDWFRLTRILHCCLHFSDTPMIPRVASDHPARSRLFRPRAQSGRLLQASYPPASWGTKAATLC
ncbi:hypothetical protein AB395_00005912 (plasmid) [Sinorhizobium fredii CCBAU 45436]|nr:hypothetical protein AB395_00005912 [Sinorhizobium fredii CCBAU 45436]